MNYATERLLAAANASLVAWEGEEHSVREEHREQIEELESAIHYFDAHGAPAKHPAIAALLRYVDDAPATVCGEGYWDDMESANADGMNQARSEAAALIRAALKALGIEPPAGIEVCGDCYRALDDHSCQCEAEQDEDEEIAA